MGKGRTNKLKKDWIIEILEGCGYFDWVGLAAHNLVYLYGLSLERGRTNWRTLWREIWNWNTLVFEQTIQQVAMTFIAILYESLFDSIMFVKCRKSKSFIYSNLILLFWIITLPTRPSWALSPSWHTYRFLPRHITHLHPIFLHHKGTRMRDQISFSPRDIHGYFFFNCYY